MKKINGDTVKGLFPKLLYFFQCISDWYVKDYDKKINIKKVIFNTENIETYYGSPARIYNDVFWDNLDYRLISQTIGNKLYIFDIGSGPGHYGIQFEKKSKYFGSYSGLDIYQDKNWPNQFPHYIDDASNSPKYFTANTNFIISQSSLEHIRKDLESLINVTKYFLLNKRKFLQIHLIPARSSLSLYLWHGWRQYSENNLSVIYSELYKLDNNIDIFAMPLGGKNCYKAHLINITIPSILDRLILRFNFLKFLRYRIYDDNNRNIKAVKLDIENFQQNKSPIFWALIIKSKEVSLGLDLS